MKLKGVTQRAAVRAAPRRVPGEVLVQFTSEASSFHVVSAHRSMGAKVIDRLDKVNCQVVKVPTGREGRYVARYARHRLVRYAEPNYLVHALYLPNDPYLNGPYETSHDGPMAQYWLPKINAPDAWGRVKTLAPGTVVAIVDTGIDYEHPDLASKVFRDAAGKVIGHNFVTGTDDAMDDNGHGTHCAGIAAAATDNGVGVAGVSFNAVRLMPVKVLDSSGSGSVANVASGVTWASDHGAKVISLSLGSSMYSQTLQEAILHARSEGAIVVAAAGNDGRAVCNYPGANFQVLGVAATGQDDMVANFSNWNIGVGLGAPGVNILSTTPDRPCELNNYGYLQSYDSLDGTSMATPVVSGLMALLVAAEPGITPEDAIGRLQATARNVAGLAGDGWDAHYGYGRVDAKAVLEATPRGGALGCVYGQVVDKSGLPVFGAQVSAGGRSYRAGTDGMFRLTNLPAGKYDVVVRKGRCWKSMKTVAVASVEVKPGQDTMARLTAWP
ncbi:MAG: S8 family serine peptidase [Bacillota bacterium]